ncbi:hypothetical protein RB195_019065 [Necator americanus]|uniref:Uncharacterized protein n=1 Tax=Necator americanus TaxID=51031 RepID=A0ABR1CDI5_NECAM
MKLEYCGVKVKVTAVQPTPLPTSGNFSDPDATATGHENRATSDFGGFGEVHITAVYEKHTISPWTLKEVQPFRQLLELLLSCADRRFNHASKRMEAGKNPCEQRRPARSRYNDSSGPEATEHLEELIKACHAENMRRSKVTETKPDTLDKAGGVCDTSRPAGEGHKKENKHSEQDDNEWQKEGGRIGFTKRDELKEKRTVEGIKTGVRNGEPAAEVKTWNNRDKL